MTVSDCEEALLNCQLVLASILDQVEGIDLETTMLCLGNLVTSQAKQWHQHNKGYTSQESRRGKNNGQLAFSYPLDEEEASLGGKYKLGNSSNLIFPRGRNAPNLSHHMVD